MERFSKRISNILCQHEATNKSACYSTFALHVTPSLIVSTLLIELYPNFLTQRGLASGCFIWNFQNQMIKEVSLLIVGICSKCPSMACFWQSQVIWPCYRIKSCIFLPRRPLFGGETKFRSGNYGEERRC